ncbi:MoaD/ThiS family protein [Desulfuromonas acetoxidans]|uniref:ThiamineS n=1 Tax=Desulfuromonas acetoxidans (strain DSM 684 / 11070) TaxID=281689 RepID=Q1JWU7_DESA6|nr:MoaD/ThiS family protein [Desulfuromonas acetoxidans]EAT14697.1 thiamineS [Desulfuromonas acetoxidans DSM 684]MBF0646305.1 MoaD/ThiS family protein [Desulfuromonas acetoxidans]NVD25114.1 MoaD/ThiS family protein [Desulfuromonas acetoxidans]NVE17265.1 MoaD/ThiS family protein [Desulfuromonas acetoxidans]
MMTITIKLFAQFRIDRFKEEQRSFSAPLTSRQLLGELGIAVEELGVLMINGRHGDVDTLLNDGDSVGIFPLVGGG